MRKLTYFVNCECALVRACEARHNTNPSENSLIKAIKTVYVAEIRLAEGLGQAGQDSCVSPEDVEFERMAESRALRLAFGGRCTRLATSLNLSECL